MKTLFSCFATNRSASLVEGGTSSGRPSQSEDDQVPRKKHEPEEIAAKLRQVDVLLSQGRPVSEAIQVVGLAPFTYFRWRKEFGGLDGAQASRLKRLEGENERLREAVLNLTLEKLLRQQASASCVAPDSEAPNLESGAMEQALMRKSA
jgi:putative transposase